MAILCLTCAVSGHTLKSQLHELNMTEELHADPTPLPWKGIC